MIISGVTFKEHNNSYRYDSHFKSNPIASFSYSFKNVKPLQNDIFEKQTIPPELSFTSAVKFSSNKFKEKFNKSFFKKLVREGVPDAYTGKPMVPQEDIDTLKTLGALKKKSSIAIKYLKEYKEHMFPIEKEIFSILENLSKKHPDLNLQELLQLKHRRAEEILIKQQTKILDKINMMIRVLPRNEYVETRKFINQSFDKILDPHPTPETRFSRKIFLHGLNEINISNPQTKEKIMAVASKLPQSSDSINAFIVKYSHATKIIDKNPFGKQEIVVIPRSPEEIGLRLLDSSIHSDEHIFPQAEFRKLEKAIENGEISPDQASTLRVSILTSKLINNIKSDTLIDDFIRQTPQYPIVENIKKHVNQLKNIADKWAKSGKLQDAATLGDYIKLLQEEFARRSKLVKIDLDDFEPKITEYHEKAALSLEKRKVKKQNKIDNASNSHSEKVSNKNGTTIENRKVQVHPFKLM